jgi:aminomethyltransferase
VVAFFYALIWIGRDVKQTPLFNFHQQSGAKMGEYAGYSMPLFYPLGVMKEHLHTRKAAGLFDISHMVHMEITGPEAAKLIERACPYEASSQPIGQARYTFFLNENAGVIDDLIITRLADQCYLIVANAGCAEKDESHIKGLAESFDAEVEVLPRGFLPLQGPKAEAVLAAVGFDVANMGFMSGIEPKSGWFLSRTGYTGEDGFEIAMPVDEVEAFAKSLLENDDVELIGLAARDSLRLEAGLSLYGQDLNEDVSPHEAGLLWAIPKPLREGKGFIGAKALAEKIAAGRSRKRVGLCPVGGRPVRAGTTLVNDAGETIGQVTSGGFGPSFDGPVALGLINMDAADAPMFADIRGKKIAMEIHALPFVPHTYKR